MKCKHDWDEEIFSCPDCKSEYKEWEALNLVTVPYGFGWARQGDASTHPLENILDNLNKEVNNLKAELIKQLWDNEQLQQQLAEKDKEIENLKDLILEYVDRRTIKSNKAFFEAKGFKWK